MKQNRIKKYTQILFNCLVLVTILLTTVVYADNDAERKKSNSITLNWEEFRSILKLDEDVVKLSWNEFTKLLSQTGFRAKCEYQVEGGDVILTREQFKKLLAQMPLTKKADLAPPCEYLIRKGTYNGIVGAESTQFNAFLDLEIFKKDRKAYSKIPLFREELAIEEIKVDGKPASIISEGGWHYLCTDAVGSHSIIAKFSVKSSLNKESPGLNFNIPQTPITHITLDIPKTGIDVNIKNSQNLTAVEKNNHTLVKGNLVPSSQMYISWRKKFTEIARGPAKVYAELFNLLSVEADVIRVTTNIKLDIVQNKINFITLATPVDYQVLEVTGQGKIIWAVRDENKKSLLDISFEYPIEGSQYLAIKSEKLLPEQTTVADFSGFQVLKSERESGFIAGEVKNDAEADIQDFENLDRIDFPKIPLELSRLSTKPILFAFKYIRHPYNIFINITKYEKAEALSAIIDYARGTTLLLEEGKLVHQFTFSIRNLWNQFLKLDLPKDASIWSVYVDGKREKASKDSDGKILIPLLRSQRAGKEEGLRSFNVELIYAEPIKKFAILGKREHCFPSPDVLINSLEWNFYLPINYKYIHFGGNLKKEKIPKIHKPAIWTKMLGSLSSLTGSSSRMVQQKPVSPVITQPDISKERTFFDKGSSIIYSPEEKLKDDSWKQSGLLSIRVNIPISGQNFRFAKKIIEKNEPLHLSFTYVNEKIINGLLILLVFIFLYIFFKIRRVFIPPVIALKKLISKLPHLLKKLLKPKILPIVIFLMLVITKLLSLYKYYPLLTLALIFLFILSLARLFKNQLLHVIKFLWRPVFSLLTTSLLLVILIISRLFLAVLPLFLLLFIGFIVSIIRLIISIFKKRKQRDQNTSQEVKLDDSEDR